MLLRYIYIFVCVNVREVEAGEEGFEHLCSFWKVDGKVDGSEFDRVSNDERERPGVAPDM